jgi:hypothetical protein
LSVVPLYMTFLRLDQYRSGHDDGDSIWVYAFILKHVTSIIYINIEIV